MTPPLLFMEQSETRRDTVEHLRVLVVEDEAAVRLLIVMHLEESGFCVIEAASAEQAIGLLTEDEAVVLVFSDIQMPGEMDGVDLARWIERERPRLKLLLTSGRPIPAAVRAWPFVAKPYRLERVEQQLRQMMVA